MGEENAFYFDEATGRWQERGKDPTRELQAPPPPPRAAAPPPPPPTGERCTPQLAWSRAKVCSAATEVLNAHA